MTNNKKVLSDREIVDRVSNYIIGKILTDKNEITHINIKDIIFNIGLSEYFTIYYCNNYLMEMNKRIYLMLCEINKRICNCDYIKKIHNTNYEDRLSEMDFKKVK